MGFIPLLESSPMRNRFQFALAILAVSAMTSPGQTPMGVPAQDSKGSALVQKKNNEVDEKDITELCKVANGSYPVLARASAIDTLARIKTPGKSTVDQVINVLQNLIPKTGQQATSVDDDKIVLMVHAVQALGAYGNVAHAALPLIAQCKGYNATLNQAVDTAQQLILPTPASTPPKTKAVKDFVADLANQDDVNARLVAAKALAQYPTDPAVLPALAKALADSDPDVLSVANDSLKKVSGFLNIQRQLYVDSLVTILQDKGNDVSVRLMAAKMLGSLGKDAVSAVNALQQVIKGEMVDSDLKSVATNALRRIQP
jgi:hypothetical protein